MVVVAVVDVALSLTQPASAKIVLWGKAPREEEESDEQCHRATDIDNVYNYV